MRIVLLSLAVLSMIGFGIISLRPAMAQAAPQSAGSGNTPSLSVTADGAAGDGLVAFSFWCRNAHEDEIWDISCAVSGLPAGAYGITELNVDDDDDGDSDSEWHVDDNADGDVNDTNENDQTDGTPGSSTRSVNTKSPGIKKNKNFRVTGVVKLPKDQNVYTILLMTTNKNSQFQEDPPANYVGGGSMEDPVHSVASSSGLVTTSVNGAFELATVGIYAQNSDADAATTVVVNPPAGIAIVDVTTVGGLNAGTWNPATRTFTFSTPVVNGEWFGLNVEFDAVPDDFTWQVGY